METELANVKNILALYHQEHLLNFYNELTDDEKNILLNQIKHINFDLIFDLYNKSKIPSEVDYSNISPLPHIEKNNLSDKEIDFYCNIGKEALENNELAIVTMAGGQGTRLGYKGPKGTYELKFAFFKKSLFEIICDDLKKTNEKYNITLPWYIMTSVENDLATREYFKSHKYFGYDKNSITFFKQEQLPLINIEGDLILQEPYLVKNASCGNGNVFKSLKYNNLLDDMKTKNIKWVSFGGIDNILLKNADPLFLGMMIHGKYEVASKSIFKEQPMEKTAVYCKKNNRNSILDYDDITLELSESKDENGSYLYREANMLSHIMSFDAVCKCCTIDLPFHRAFKKNAFVNEEGMKQVPDGPNTFKFENFIFDAFSYFDNMLLLRVNSNEEFAPIKSFTGIYNPDTAMDKYEKLFGILRHDL